MSSLQCSGVVLAGGVSKRMGCDKRFLDLDGIPLLEHVLARLRPLVSELIVVTREPESFPGLDVRCVTDHYPGMGVLAGVHAGLSAAHNRWAFMVAGDMPLLDPKLLQMMALEIDPDGTDVVPCDVLVPRWRGEFEPLHGLYRVDACAPAAERALLAGRRRIVSFYPEVRVRVVPEAVLQHWDPARASFFNVNTPEEWVAAKEHL